MNKDLLNNMKTFIKNKFNFDDKQFETYAHFSVYLSLFIAYYAHKDQYRNNDEPYIYHPLRMHNKYKDLVGIDDTPFCIDLDIMHKLGLPYEGIMELCLLHDVVEDTSITLEDIEEIFIYYDFKNYFNLYIKNNLELLTHNKGENYSLYILNVSFSKEASLVKILDMYDNLLCLTNDFDDQNNLNLKEKMKNYLEYSFLLNDKYKFNKIFKEYNDYRNKNNLMK